MLLYFNSNVLSKISYMGYVSYKEPWMHFKRSTDEFILYIIKNGELFIKEDEQKYILKRGDFFILQPYRVHIGFEKACCDYYYIHFKHPKMSALLDRSFDEIAREIIFKRNTSMESDPLSDKSYGDSLCYLPKFYNIANISVLMSIFQILQEAVEDFNQKFENYKNLCSYKLSELFIRISRDYASTEIEKLQPRLPKSFTKVHAVLNYMNSEYPSNITSKGLEKLFETNFDYLNRIFRKITGHTIFNHLNMVRVNKAKELIETTPIKFSEIAYLVGFNDPFYFSKIFKKYTGVSPMQYSKNRYRRS